MGEAVQTRGRFLYEFDCAERMERRLSTYGVVNGKAVHDETTSEWSHLPPESNGAMLAKILCPAR